MDKAICCKYKNMASLASIKKAYTAHRCNLTFLTL